MSTVTLAKSISEQPEEHAISSVAFESLVISLLLTEIALGAVVFYNWIWLAVPLVLITAHVMHGLLIGLHEAVHGLLRRSRRLNEFDGLLIGMVSLLSLTLYRVVH